MKRPLLAATLVLVGLGLGATLLRDQVPVSGAQTQTQTQSGTQTTGTSAGGQAVNEAAARLQNERNTIDIVGRYEPGLVYITTEQDVVEQDPMAMMFGGGGQTQVRQGVGSGFFVNAQGDILTNYHVVAGDGGSGAAARIRIRVMDREESVPARVIGLAPQYDLALIRAEGLPANLIRPIPLGNSDALKVGQKAVAMGAPFGLEFSVTEGIVSSTARQIPIGFSGSGSGEGITQKAIQTDAAINPGNSGGPLLDSTGRVIGINTQIYSPAGAASGTGQSAGVGFAIPINAAKNLLPRLQAANGGLVFAPRLGITPGLVVQAQGQAIPVGLSALSSEGKRELSLPENGLVVGEVTANSPAARAGLRGAQDAREFPGGQVALGGDVITRVDGEEVDALEDLQAALIDKQEGDTVSLTVVRAGQTRKVNVTLDDSSFSE
ncbi:trypsin-like peptidase domain-containing protein [Deinococcus sp. YIM 134068]|uniref:S1C family serine protease n=1 Tax=Deinococcus lichenicola TaxID=3118910 RepID=UPI002F933368